MDMLREGRRVGRTRVGRRLDKQGFQTGSEQGVKINPRLTILLLLLLLLVNTQSIF